MLHLDLLSELQMLLRAHVKLFRRYTRTRMLLRHYKGCKSDNCQLCGYVDAAVKKRKAIGTMSPLGASISRKPRVSQTDNAMPGAGPLTGHRHTVSQPPPPRTAPSGTHHSTVSSTRPLPVSQLAPGSNWPLGTPGLTASGSRPRLVRHCPKGPAALTVEPNTHKKSYETGGTVLIMPLFSLLMPPLSLIQTYGNQWYRL